MQQLITIGQTSISDKVVQTVNARDLHAFIESKQEFSNWIKGRIEQYGFVADQDFTVDTFINGRKQTDYYISIDMAKELAMVERNARGKEARQYFIECERKVLQAPIVAIPDFYDPAAAARAWADAFEAKNAALAIADHAIATKAEIGNRREATAMNTASLRIVSEFPRYLVSRDGEVYVTTKTNSRTGEVSLRDVPKKLKHVLDIYGYRIVSLRSDDAKKVAKVHRLVASAFLENPQGKPQVNHINGIRHDSRAANLEWVTGSENQIHAHQVLHTKANAYWTGKENKHLQKPVAQVSLDGKLMMIWPSMKSISLSGAACKSSVEKSIRSGKPTGGFYLYHADVWREVYALPIVVACEGVAA